MSLHQQLLKRQADGNPIRVGLIGAGKFEALQEAIPEFKNQAKLMGL